MQSCLDFLPIVQQSQDSISINLNKASRTMSTDPKDKELSEKEHLAQLDPGLPEAPVPVAPEDSEQEASPDPDLMKSISIERRIKAFIQGDITLADVYGMNHEEQYAVAEYGKMLFDEGKVKDAETVFTALTTLNPYDENFHAGLASVYIKQDRKEEARIELERAIQLNQTLISTRVTHAELLMMEGRFDEVLQALEEIFAMDPEGEEDATQRARGLAMAIATMAREVAEKKEQSA